MTNINKLNTANQMRVLMGRMRTGKFDANESVKPKSNLNMRDMLKITRKLNEDTSDNKKTTYDQPIEEEKFLNNFKDVNVNVKFIELEIYDGLVFWGGTVDGIIQFTYKVTPDEASSGVEFNYLKDFSPDNPESELVIEKITNYYDSFYKYWQNNLIQK